MKLSERNMRKLCEGCTCHVTRLCCFIICTSITGVNFKTQTQKRVTIFFVCALACCSIDRENPIMRICVSSFHCNDVGERTWIDNIWPCLRSTEGTSSANGPSYRKFRIRMLFGSWYGRSHQTLELLLVESNIARVDWKGVRWIRGPWSKGEYRIWHVYVDNWAYWGVVTGQNAIVRAKSVSSDWTTKEWTGIWFGKVWVGRIRRGNHITV